MKNGSHPFLERQWVIVALGNFVVAALMGLILRATPLFGFPWLHFRNMTHAHSHAAMMGWLYMAIFALLMHFFLPMEERKKKKYKRLFVLLQIAVIGMMASFPFQGYGPISISFSALHLFSSYAFLTFIWRNAQSESRQPIILLKTAIVLMMFSTLGVYALGPVTAKIGRMTDAYHLCIQFFLHFQFQGWFVFAIAALLLQRLSQLGISMSRTLFRIFHVSLLVAVFGMMALPTVQYTQLTALLPINTIGALAQLLAVVLLLGFLFGVKDRFSKPSLWIQACGWMALGSILLKAIGQAVLSWPEIAIIPMNIRPMVIGFIHLLMLGNITAYLLMVLLQNQVFQTDLISFRLGISSLFSGLIITEFLLFAQGTSIWVGSGGWDFYDETLFAGSILLLLGVIGLFLSVVFTQGNPSNSHEIATDARISTDKQH